jgi:serine/threonine protein phosphatase PrpC
VTCEPDIIQHDRTEQDEFLVLACDGIWDCMTNQQVVNYVLQQLSERHKLDTICEEIMDYCLAPTSEGGGVGCDNMSVIIVAILNGKTEEQWYDWMARRTEGIPKDQSSLAIKDEKPLPELKKDSPELKKDSPELKKDSPELKKDSPELKKDSPELKKDSPEQDNEPTVESPQHNA